MSQFLTELRSPILALTVVCGSLFLPVTAEPDTHVFPNDPYFGEQLGFYNPPGADSLRLSSRSNRRDLIPAGDSLDHRIAEAWTITTGSADVIIAVLDDGFPYTDPDIRENIWRNPGESGLDASGIARESNGKDDDGNGYIDDVIGWDFVFDDADPDGYAFDGMDETRIAPYHHSAPALGIIGARGNNGIGVAGINWRVSLQLLRIAAQGNTNGGRAGRAARAIRYAVDNGARAINWSGFVSDTNSPGLDSLRDAVAYADSAGVLLVCGAGNWALDLDLPENRNYPEAFDFENIILVAEVDFDGKLYRVTEDGKFVGGSNFGGRWVEIAALARHFTLSFLGSQVSVFGQAGGTSNSGPVVAGVVGLICSVRPDLDGAAVKRILLDSARRLPDLHDKVICGGVVDAAAAVRRALAWPSAGGNTPGR